MLTKTLLLLLAVTKTGLALFHCSSDICLYSNQSTSNNISKAQLECKNNGSILLEIYDEKYQNITIEAVKRWGINGDFLIINLGKNSNGQFIWLTSGRYLTYNNWRVHPTEEVVGAFFVPNLSLNTYFWEPRTGNMGDQHKMICLYQATSNQSTTSSTATPYTISDFSSITTNTTGNLTPEANHSSGSQIGLGVGVAVAVLFTIVFFSLVIWIFRKKLCQRMFIESNAVEGKTYEELSIPQKQTQIYTDLKLDKV